MVSAGGDLHGDHGHRGGQVAVRAALELGRDPVRPCRPRRAPARPCPATTPKTLPLLVFRNVADTGFFLTALATGSSAAGIDRRLDHGHGRPIRARLEVEPGAHGRGLDGPGLLAPDEDEVPGEPLRRGPSRSPRPRRSGPGARPSPSRGPPPRRARPSTGRRRARPRPPGRGPSCAPGPPAWSRICPSSVTAIVALTGARSSGRRASVMAAVKGRLVQHEPWLDRPAVEGLADLSDRALGPRRRRARRAAPRRPWRPGPHDGRRRCTGSRCRHHRAARRTSLPRSKANAAARARVAVGRSIPDTSTPPT